MDMHCTGFLQQILYIRFRQVSTNCKQKNRMYEFALFETKGIDVRVYLNVLNFSGRIFSFRNDFLSFVLWVQYFNFFDFKPVC